MEQAQLADVQDASHQQASGIEAEIDALIASERWDDLVVWLRERWVELWFTVRPERLQPLLSEIPSDVLARTEAGGFLGSLIDMDHPPFENVAASLRTRTNLGKSDLTLLGMTAANLRLRGSVVESFELLRSLSPFVGSVETAVADSSGGMLPMFYVQAGTSAMLAGELHLADTWFERASGVAEGPFAFVARDAITKRALLHALFGSSHRAEAELEKAAALPRTTSWVEIWIDGVAELAATAIRLEKATSPESRGVPDFPWRSYGEMWPFALWVAAKHTLASSGPSATLHLLDKIENLTLPGAEGNGVTGGVLPLWRTLAQLAQGKRVPRRATGRNLFVDGPIVEIVRARHELMTGRVDAALIRLGKLTQTTQMWPKLSSQVTALRSSCFAVKGDIDDARESLLAQDVVAELSFQKLRLFPREAVELAREVWFDELESRGLLHIDSVFPAGAADRAPLTGREQELLRLLSTDMTSAQICGELFVTENTLKTHRRNLYRKIGASSRVEARRIFHLSN